MLFQSPTYGELTVDALFERIATYITESPQQHKVIIGTDSSLGDKGVAQFITAIVLHRVGRGGLYFWNKSEAPNMQVLHNRMYHEAVLSLDLARYFVDQKFERLVGASAANTLEIHIDVGENGPTRVMIKELVGMVTGHGYQVRTKPHAFAASKVADRHT